MAREGQNGFRREIHCQNLSGPQTQFRLRAESQYASTLKFSRCGDNRMGIWIIIDLHHIKVWAFSSEHEALIAFTNKLLKTPSRFKKGLRLRGLWFDDVFE